MRLKRRGTWSGTLILDIYEPKIKRCDVTVSMMKDEKKVGEGLSKRPGLVAEQETYKVFLETELNNGETGDRDSGD